MSQPSLTRSGTARRLPNHAAAAAYISKRVPFDSGSSFSGDTYASRGIGYLRQAWIPVFYADANDIDYVVYSYSTPIAWHTPQGWTVPNETYSVTTSGKHMPQVWRGINYGHDEPVRRRIDAVTIVSLTRLNNSAAGNPRFDITFSDGRIATTSSDASIVYDAENQLRSGQLLYVEFTAAGRVYSWKPATATGFEVR